MGNAVSTPTTDIRSGQRVTENLEQFTKDFEKLTKCTDRGKRVKSIEMLDNRVFQNPNTETGVAKYVQENVESWVNYTLLELKKLNSRWNFALVKSGSFYDGLRVGLPYEFDYMLEFRDTGVVNVRKSGPTNEYRLFTSNPNMVFSKNDVQGQYNGPLVVYADEDENFTDSEYNNEIHSLGLRYALYTDIHQVLTTLGRQNSTDINILQINYIKDTNPNFCVRLEFHGIGIMLDLVPCIKFQGDYFSLVPDINQTLIKEIVTSPNNDKNSLFDDPNRFISDNLYLVCTGGKWRVSHSMIEQKIMQNLSNEVKRPLRVLKYFCNSMFIEAKAVSDHAYMKDEDGNLSERLDIFGYKCHFKSYPMKCMFLDTISDAMKNNLMHVYLKDPWLMLCAMLHRLGYYHNIPTNTSYLILLNSGAVFGKRNMIYTTISQNKCNQFLGAIGDMLSDAERDGNFDRFPMLNYPKLPTVITMPSY